MTTPKKKSKPQPAAGPKEHFVDLGVRVRVTEDPDQRAIDRVARHVASYLYRGFGARVEVTETNHVLLFDPSKDGQWGSNEPAAWEPPRDD